LADGDILAADTQIAQAVSHYMHTQASVDAVPIKTRFDALMEAYHYQGVTLIDPEGNALMHVGDNSDFNTQVSHALIQTVNKLGKTHHSDFYIDDRNQLNLQVLAPIFANGTSPMAYVFIQTGFYGPILPSLQMWPTQSATSDSLLFKRNQNEVIIVDATPDDFNGDGINFLKYSKDTVYDPASPVSRGKNLQGKLAYSAVLPITGTSWYYLTEVTKDEVMAELYQLLVWTGVSALIALGIVSSVLTLLWKQQKAAYRLALELKDIELRKLLDKFHHLPFIGTGTVDGVTFKWLDANPRLCEILGYSAQDLLNLKCTDLSHPDEIAEDQAFYARLTSGEISHYVREKRFIHQSGKTLHGRVEVSAIRDDYGAIALIVIAIEDITGRITAEEALKHSEQRLDLVLRGVMMAGGT
jgi:PAS domain S-box-containing protein